MEGESEIKTTGAAGEDIEATGQPSTRAPRSGPGPRGGARRGRGRGREAGPPGAASIPLELDEAGKPILRPAVFDEVETVTPTTRGINLKVQVLTEPEEKVNRERFDGSRLIVSEAVVGDETGRIVMTFRNDQVLGIQPGVFLIVRNAFVQMYEEHVRLEVDSWGKIQRAPEQDNSLTVPETPDISAAAHPGVGNRDPKRTTNRGPKEAQSPDSEAPAQED